MFTFTNTLLVIAAGCIMLAAYGCVNPAVIFVYIACGVLAAHDVFRG